MVRAILSGQKTQTRRVVSAKHLKFFDQSAVDMIEQWDSRPFPYGKRGDQLWVREAWMDLKGTGVERVSGDRSRFAYRADTPAGSYGDEARKDYGLKWRPSIHMPRAASRITLEITDVRVERLQDISEADAIAEGVDAGKYSGLERAAARTYSDLWESINGAGSWDANPWVWVVSFKRVP